MMSVGENRTEVCESLRKADIKVYIRPLTSPDENFEFVKFLDDKKTVYAKCFSPLRPMKNLQDYYYSFQFDEVFYKYSQAQIYAILQDAVNNAIDGYSTVIMGFGQTCSGKTFTMNGLFFHYQQRGISPRFAQTILTAKAELKDEYKIECGLSFCEINGNEFTDLLNFEAEKIPATKHFNKFSNVNIFVITSEDQAHNLLFEGAGRRNFNKKVTRSYPHLSTGIVTYYIISTSLKESKAVQKIAKIHIVDVSGADTFGVEPFNGKSLLETGISNRNLSFIQMFILFLRNCKEDQEKIKTMKRLSLLINYLSDTFHNRSFLRFICHIRTSKECLPRTLSMLRLSQLIQGIEPQLLKPNTIFKSELESSALKNQLQDIEKRMIRNAMFCESELENFLCKSRIDHLNNVAEDYLDGKIDNLTLLGVSHVETILSILKQKYNAIKETNTKSSHSSYQRSKSKIRASISSKSLNNPMEKHEGSLIPSEGLGVGYATRTDGSAYSDALVRLKDNYTPLSLKVKESSSKTRPDFISREVVWNEFSNSNAFQKLNETLIEQQHRKTSARVEYDKELKKLYDLKIEKTQLQKSLLEMEMKRHTDDQEEIFTEEGLIVPSSTEIEFRKKLAQQDQVLSLQKELLHKLQELVKIANNDVDKLTLEIEEMFQEFCKEKYGSFQFDLEKIFTPDTETGGSTGLVNEDLNYFEKKRAEKYSKQQQLLFKVMKEKNLVDGFKNRKWNTDILH